MDGHALVFEGPENAAPGQAGVDRIGGALPEDAAQVGVLTIVAHDMRGPLANLSLLLEGIAAYSAAGAPERVAASLETAEAVVSHLDAMLSALLERARSAKDPLAFRPRPVDVLDVLEMAAGLNEATAAAKSIRLHTYGVEPLVARGDHRLLLEAIDNLIGNAIKHTRPGGSVVCEAAISGGEAVVRVIDEGPGLTEADLARAFRPFTRLSATGDGSRASHGLGLWIVRLIAERHGGSIEAENRRDGRGAEFTIRLPILAQHH
ncbi:MAG: HAMP domain-containing sensor histidine kinase [Pseudomonadota bacterium]